jgi:hypothetical protein
LYRELAFRGDIPETNFVPLWARMRIQRGHNRRLGFSGGLGEPASDDASRMVRQHFARRARLDQQRS